MADAVVPVKLAYDAFASHATDPDGALVRRVESVIESFHRRRGLPREYALELQLCVDGRDFVFPRRMGESVFVIEPIVRQYQKKSKSLLIFAGPTSRDHPWINKEIEWWAEERPDGPVYFALTHGADTSDPDTYMPKALRDRGGPDNPIFFDLRGFYRQRSLSPLLAYSAKEARLRREARSWGSVRSFREELAKLVAQLVSDATDSSIPVANLVSAYEEVERRERVWRLIGRTILAIIAATLIGLLVWVTTGLLNEQHRQKITSWQQAATVLSTPSGANLLDALAYAASAVKDGDDPDGLDALYNLLPRIVPVDQAIRPLAGESSSEQIQTAALLRNDEWLATGGRDGVLYLNDAVTGTPLAKLPLDCGRIRSIISLRDSNLIAVASDRGLRLVSIETRPAGLSVEDVGTLLSGKRIAAVAVDNRGRIYAGELFGRLWRLDPEGQSHSQAPSFGLTDLGIVMDPRDTTLETPSSVFALEVRGTNLIVAGIDGVLTIFDVSSVTSALPAPVHQIVHPASVLAMDVTQDGSTIAIADDAGDIYLYAADLSDARHAELHVPNPASLNQNINGGWDIAPVDQVPAVGVAFNDSGSVVAATGHDHTVKFFLSNNLRLIGTDVHAAATRGVIFSSKGETAFTFGDDGLVNRVNPLSASPPLRIGGVTAFTVASETDEIAYWVETSNNTGKVFVVRPNVRQPGRQVGELSGNNNWDGILFGAHTFLVRRTSAFVPEFPLTTGAQLSCEKAGLEHPNEAGRVEFVDRLTRGTRVDEVSTVTRPAADGPSRLRLWSAANCSEQWHHDYDGAPGQASTANGVVATIEGKSSVRVFAPPGDMPVAEISFPFELLSIAVGPQGDNLVVIASDRTKACLCSRSPSTDPQTANCESRSRSHVCQMIAENIGRLSGQAEFSASGRYLTLAYGSAGVALAQMADGWNVQRIAPEQVRAITPPFAFSPDEGLLAVPAGDAGIAVMDPHTLAAKALLPTPSRVMQLAFLRDGTNRLISLDGSVLRSWHWDRNLLLKEACRRWPNWLVAGDRANVPLPLSRKTVCGPPAPG
ncbi:hypothetical protein ACU8OQ_25775 (plasmid) [Rhizobium leguminosarum]